MLECDGGQPGQVRLRICVACKEFKGGFGICSHVLAINHIKKKHNLRYELKTLQTSASKKAAMRAEALYVRSALMRAPPVWHHNSSDEEEPELFWLCLGKEGK